MLGERQGQDEHGCRLLATSPWRRRGETGSCCEPLLIPSLSPRSKRHKSGSMEDDIDTSPGGEYYTSSNSPTSSSRNWTEDMEGGRCLPIGASLWGPPANSAVFSGYRCHTSLPCESSVLGICHGVAIGPPGLSTSWLEVL